MHAASRETLPRDVGRPLALAVSVLRMLVQFAGRAALWRFVAQLQHSPVTSGSRAKGRPTTWVCRFQGGGVEGGPVEGAHSVVGTWLRAWEPARALPARLLALRVRGSEP